MRVRRLWSVLILPLLGACPAPAQDADPTPEPTPEGCPDEPGPKSDPCLPDCGNELFVGMPCSEDGGECSDHLQWDPDVLHAFMCTADVDDGDLDFCTLACVAHEDCGADAILGGDPENPNSGSGCFPPSCWEGEIPSAPAGDGDSGR